MIIFVVSIGLILSILYLTTSTKNYEIRSLIQVYDNSASVYGSSSPSDMLFSSSSSDDVQLLVNLYKTRTNILKIIEEFKLNVFVGDDHDLEFSNFKINDIKTDEVIKLTN